VTVPYAIKLAYAVYIVLGELARSKESKGDSEKSRLISTEDSNGQREDSESQRESLEGQRESSESQRNEEKVLKKVMIMEWLESSRRHKIILVILISLAGADVEALNILDFRFCGYEFGIKLSEEFEERIIIGKMISIIIKNIPELAIRVCNFFFFFVLLFFKSDIKQFIFLKKN
jgi:hypothetical protein